MNVDDHDAKFKKYISPNLHEPMVRQSEYMGMDISHYTSLQLINSTTKKRFEMHLVYDKDIFF